MAEAIGGLDAGEERYRYALDSWFLHEPLALSILSDDKRSYLESALLSEESDPFAAARNRELIQRALLADFGTRPPAELAVAWARDELQDHRLVGIEQTFAFKGLSAAARLWKREQNARATFSAYLNVDKSVRILGDYSTEHLTSNTAYTKLTGTPHLYIVGYVQSADAASVTLRPGSHGGSHFAPRIVRTRPLRFWSPDLVASVLN